MLHVREDLLDGYADRREAFLSGSAIEVPFLRDVPRLGDTFRQRRSNSHQCSPREPVP